MVVALLFLTVIVFISIDVFRTRRQPAVAATHPAVAALSESVRPLERYFHPGHSWALMEETNAATVGIDDFARRFVGDLDSVEIENQGAAVRQGEPLVTLRWGRRSLTLVSPLSGNLIEVNDGLKSRPALLKDAPLGKGWIARISPSNPGVELRNLLKGAMADSWREAVQAQLASWFSPQLGVVLQDGGQWSDNLNGLLSDQDWENLAQTLFLVRPSPRADS